MNQHKDLLYRQKYATCQLNNRTFSTQNTKISARSLAISYICFQVRIVKKKTFRKKGGEAIYYQLLRKIWWLPHPRPPTRALYAKLQREKLHFLSLLTTILKALICWKLESFRGLCPWAPGRALRRAPGPHPYEARAVRFAHGFFRPPLFCKSWISHVLYTSPPCSSKSLAPRGVDPGGAGEQSPPPPWKYCGGGGKHIVLPPPPNNFVNLKKLYVMQE